MAVGCCGAFKGDEGVAVVANVLMSEEILI